jgi:AraC-like DNA-binding protein/ligand-binding sensor protein
MNRYQIGDTKDVQNQRGVSNIINRREIEPLLLKALEVVKSYERAVDCKVSIIDQAGQSIHSPETLACALCIKCHPPGSQVLKYDTFPCIETHVQGINEAQRMGGSYIYVCDMGFIYWSSPIYSSGRLGGGLIAGGLLSTDKQPVIQKLSLRCRGSVNEAEIRASLEEISVRSVEEIGALAQMLLMCAEQISRVPEGSYETVKYNPGDEGRKEGPPPELEEDKKNFRIGYSLDKERMLLAALRRGDNEAGRQILNQILENLFTSNPHNFNFIQLRAIELVVLLSREAITVDNSEDGNLLEKNNRYLRHIQEVQNIEDLTNVMQTIVERMGSQIFSFQGIRHASALRKAERYIWENYTRKICLQEVAEASGLSAPYFSTIFKEEMGENLSNYLNRLRVEKASSMLTETSLPLSEIAGACGFEDQSWFSKIFKSYTGVSPGKYRETGMGLELLDPAGEEISQDGT